MTPPTPRSQAASGPAPDGLTGASLFAGIGGFDLAMRRAGIKVAAAVEIDPACRMVLARHFPETTLFDDVSEVTGDQLRTAGLVPGRGVLAAGWPCQGNSAAGRRRGMADPRSGLWRHVVRLLAETRPLWFVGENVPGILGIGAGRDFRQVLADLDDLGYGVAWRVLDAQWFGVPQRRRRVFLAGCLGDGAAPVEVLLEPGSGGWHPAQVRPPTAGTPGGAGGGAGISGPQGSRPGRRVAPTLTSGGSTTGGTRAPGTNPDTAASLIVSTLQGGGRRGHRIDAEAAVGGHLLPVGEDGGPLVPVFAPLTAGAPAGGGVNPAGRRLEDDWNLAAAGTAVRRLTPRECERLQGFPDDWTAGQSDAARYRQLGNAVAVPVAAWITARITAAAARSTTRPGTAGEVPA